MKFSEYLAIARAQSSLTQIELVEALYDEDIELFSSLTTNMVSRWENGFSTPSLEKKQSVLRYFVYKNNALIEFENIETVELHFYKQIATGYLNKTSEVQYDFPLGEDVGIEDLSLTKLHEYSGIEGVVERLKQLKQALESSYSTISKEQAFLFSHKESNIYVVAEYNGMFLGFFSAVKLKPTIFEKIINFKMRIQEITEEHLATDNERGSLFLLFFFSLNLKTTARLNIRFLSYLIKNQSTVENVGALVSNKISPERIKTFNMKKFKSTILKDGLELVSYKEDIREVMLSEYCVKTFFLPE